MSVASIVRTPLADENSSIFGVGVVRKKNTSKSSIDGSFDAKNASLLSCGGGGDGLQVGAGTPKRAERRRQVVSEMLDTEENYLSVLETLIEVFKKPLEEDLKASEQLGQSPSKMDAKEIHTVFAKLPPLAQVHTEIRNQLKSLLNVWEPTALVGRIWAHAAPELERLYPPYVNNYDHAIEVIEDCEMRPEFLRFLKKAQANPKCNRNSLRDLLIRPVQRIPSVELLLKEIIKRTERTSPDWLWLEAAHEGVKKVLHKTNESKRHCEKQTNFLETCQEIENIPPVVVSSHRELVQQLDVTVLEAGGVLSRHKGRTVSFFLFNDCVEAAKARQSSSSVANGNATFSGSIRPSFGFHANGTLSRQVSLGSLRRFAAPRKERKKYKHIELFSFSSFRTVQVEKNYGVFMIKIRDQKADELCLFQCTNSYTLEIGIEFFNNLVQRILSNTTRELRFEELTLEQIVAQRDQRPDEVDTIIKAIRSAAAADGTKTMLRLHRDGSVKSNNAPPNGPRRSESEKGARPDGLRRAISNISLISSFSFRSALPFGREKRNRPNQISSTDQTPTKTCDANLSASASIDESNETAHKTLVPPPATASVSAAVLPYIPHPYSHPQNQQRYNLGLPSPSPSNSSAVSLIMIKSTTTPKRHSAALTRYENGMHTLPTMCSARHTPLVGITEHDQIAEES